MTEKKKKKKNFFIHSHYFKKEEKILPYHIAYNIIIITFRGCTELTNYGICILNDVTRSEVTSFRPPKIITSSVMILASSINLCLALWHKPFLQIAIIGYAIGRTLLLPPASVYRNGPNKSHAVRALRKICEKFE